MAQNEVKILFTAVDNVTKTAEKIQGGLKDGFDLADAVQAFSGITGGAVLATNQVLKLNEAVVKLSEKKPELFTPEQLKTAQNYEASIKGIEGSLDKIQISVGTAIMPIVAADLEALTDIGGAFEALRTEGFGGLADWAAEIINGFDDAAAAADGFSKKVITLMEQVSGASEEQTAKIVYNNLLQKISVDGITQAEFELAQEAGKALGIFDQAAIDSAIAINRLTDDVIAGKRAVEDLANAVNSLPARKQIIVETIVNNRLATLLPGMGRTQRKSGGGINMDWLTQEVNRRNTRP